MIKAVLVYVMCTGMVDKKGNFIDKIDCISHIGKQFKSMAECKKEEYSTVKHTHYDEKKVTITTKNNMQGCIDISQKVIKKEVYKLVKE